MNAITEIRKLLPTEYHWIKNNYARDCDNNIVETHNYLACKFCLSAAIERTFGRAYSEFSPQFRINFKTRLTKIILTHFNERLKHPHNHGVIAELNDHPDTTFKDIQFLLNQMEKSNGNPTLST